MGGLSRSLQRMTGRQKDFIVIDSTEEEVEVEDLKASIERASRTRLFNPVWLDGMLKDEFRRTILTPP